MKKLKFKHVRIIKYETVRHWYLRYKEYGHNAFETSDQHHSYSKKFKLSLIEEYANGKCSIADLAAKYNISYSNVRTWIDKIKRGV